MLKKVYRNEFFIAMFAVLIVINVLPFAFAEWVYGEAFRDHFFLSLMNTTIYLDNKFCFMAVEICNEESDLIIPIKFNRILS